LISCSNPDGEHELWLAHRSVLEAREFKEWGPIFSELPLRTASRGETKKVADLFGKLRVIVCKLRLHSGFNIKKFLRLAVIKAGQRARGYSAGGIGAKARGSERGQA
jgi:hypothetical protein